MHRWMFCWLVFFRRKQNPSSALNKHRASANPKLAVKISALLHTSYHAQISENTSLQRARLWLIILQSLLNNFTLRAAHHSQSCLHCVLKHACSIRSWCSSKQHLVMVENQCTALKSISFLCCRCFLNPPGRVGLLSWMALFNVTLSFCKSPSAVLTKILKHQCKSRGQ